MHVNILGVDYEIVFQTKEQNSKLSNYDGLSELYSHKLIIPTGYENDATVFDNIDEYKLQVIRHEIMHAIFHESGLSNYCNDENLVDFLAIQFPKIYKIMKDAEEQYRNNQE